MIQFITNTVIIGFIGSILYRIYEIFNISKIEQNLLSIKDRALRILYDIVIIHMIILFGITLFKLNGAHLSVQDIRLLLESTDVESFLIIQVLIFVLTIQLYIFINGMKNLYRYKFGFKLYFIFEDKKYYFDKRLNNGMISLYREENFKKKLFEEFR